MNGLVLFCISVFVFITCNCDEEETLEGANTCIIEEKYFVSKKVVELWPMRKKSHVFCWKVPPRCTKYYIKMVPFEVEKKFPEFRNVTGCCDGYKKVGDKCEPECLKQCVNGKCTGPGECKCNLGYSGTSCDEVCPMGTWGMGCSKECECNNATCDPFSGECICPSGWIVKECGELNKMECNTTAYSNDTSDMKTSNHTPQELLRGGLRKHKHSRIIKATTLTEEERLIFQYVEERNHRLLADKCAEGIINMNIADIDNNYQTPLHLAASQGCIITLLTVIACGVKINAVDSNGNTPLHIAIIYKQSHICSSLLFKAANPFIYNNNKKTAYQLAMDSTDHWIKYIFHNKHLHWYQRIRKLNSDEIKLMQNVREDNYQTVGDLCMKHVDVSVENVEDGQNTAFHLAAKYGKNIAPMVLTLIHCGGDINARNAFGNTPLHIAVMSGDSNKTSVLLLHRANPFIDNYEGLTAHDFAKESVEPSLRTLFEEPLLSWYHNSHSVL